VFWIRKVVNVQHPLKGAATDADLPALHPADSAGRAVELQADILGGEFGLLTQ
jgi:hypothetical protein